MKKKLIFGLLVLALVALPLFGACAKQSPAPAPAPSPAPAPAPAPAGTIELIFSHLQPEVAPSAKIAKAWGDKVEQLSGGRVKFVYYWGATLTPPGETVKSIQAGVCDVSFFPPEQNFQPLTYCLSLPFLGIPSMKAGGEILQQLFNKFPEVAAEYEGMKVFSPMATVESNIYTTKKVVRAPADLKGMKIRVAMAQSIAKMIELAGGTPVEVVPPDLYISLERGMVEGVYFPITGIDAFQCTPLLPYHNIFGDSGTSRDTNTLVFCLNTWKKLPADIQKIIADLEPWYTDEMINSDTANVERINAAAKEAGHTFTYLTPEEIKVWADLVAPIHQEWIAGMEAQGKPGQAVYDEVKRLIAGYSK